MKPYLALLALIFLTGTAFAMNQSETAYYQGIQTGYSLGYAAVVGQSDPAKELEYNGMVAKLNSWLASVGNSDQWANLQKNTAYVLPPIFGGPIILVNESNADGIIHAIDGNQKAETTYTTNDMNLLPEKARYNSTSGNYDKIQGDYLGGV